MMNDMHRNHVLEDEKLETVSGGADEAGYKFNVGDLVKCKIASMNGAALYQPGRVKARSKSDKGVVYTVEMGSKNSANSGLTFSGETRDFPESRLKTYNG